MRTPQLLTPRLRLLAMNAATAAAALTSRSTLASLLDAHVPDAWPPVDLADVQALLASKLAEHPHEAGWWGWFIIAQPSTLAPQSPATLIGSAGCTRWGESNTPQFGYGLLPAYFRQGFASEAAVALIDWTLAQPGITRVEATTFERHDASIKILTRCGFSCQGTSPQDAQAPDSDRQGRGKLLLFTRDRAHS